MSRATHATTPSGDEVTLEANAQLAARERTVAQVEHNAMQALDLVRATLHALGELTGPLDRLAALLSHSRSVPLSTISPELQRLIEQLGASIHAAALREDPLLTGGGASFVVENPQDSSSAPLQIELPDLSGAYAELAELDIATSTHALITLKQVHLASTVQAAKKQFTGLAQRLTRLLGSQRPPRPLMPRAEDEGFVAMIQTVRQHVLHAGDAALRVQGSPSSRATWLIEALRNAL
jgi:hypothetical protein